LGNSALPTEELNYEMHQGNPGRGGKNTQLFADERPIKIGLADWDADLRGFPNKLIGLERELYPLYSVRFIP
jgi:hypothetical protein